MIYPRWTVTLETLVGGIWEEVAFLCTSREADAMKRLATWNGLYASESDFRVSMTCEVDEDNECDSEARELQEAHNYYADKGV